ncbi:conjugal transfer protein [Micromonospora sp. DT81.3]|uniref:conjugal transfer protein n=1 Tax=Micromonospora sp. DT81.3 TaxID=3416523 RepID=UPI003CE680DF
MDQQRAGGYALGFVASWLSATKNLPGDLANYIDVGALRQVSEEAWQYRDLGIATVTPVEDSGFVNVVVAANVKELSLSETGEGSTEIWPRRYFQVAVSLEDGALRVVGLPAPVAPPVQGSTSVLIYTQTIGSSDPAAQTVTAFLGAYLAGSGDLSRYSSPGTDFIALDPAPYVMVEVIDLRSDVLPSTSLSDGDTIRALVTVSLLSPLEQQLTSTYTLTLTVRASRWEVSAIDLAPQAIPTSGSATPQPSPTGDGNSKGN